MKRKEEDLKEKSAPEVFTGKSQRTKQKTLLYSLLTETKKVCNINIKQTAWGSPTIKNNKIEEKFPRKPEP